MSALHQQSKPMDSNANIMLGFRWVKEVNLQSSTKINAQDDCLNKAKSPRSAAIDHCPNEINYSRPHHQWIPKSSIHPDVHGG